MNPQLQEFAARWGAERWNRGGHPLLGGVISAGVLVERDSYGNCNHPLHDIAQAIDATVGAGGIALLGEVHDNAAQHTLRVTWIRSAAGLIPSIFRPDGGRKLYPGLVLEHIRTDQKPALDQFAAFNARARRLGHAGDMFRFLDWKSSGWPDQNIFEPLFTAAIQAKLPIYPGDLPRETIRKAAKEGEVAIPSEERARLKLDAPLDPRLQDALLTELEDSHCGMLPKTAFGNMAFAQRYRDAHLADAILKAAAIQGDTRGVVLLAGNGHVRNDRGVPYYLRQRAPDKRIVSVMLVEVEDGKTDPQAYVPRDPNGRPAADYIVLTPRQDRPDPCEGIRSAMKAK